jgi:putative FmdB family regulatory protein
MPMYTWKCEDCDKETEVDRHIRNYNDPHTCECGSENTTRLISKGTTFNLEGGGWFKDGY